MVGWLAEPPGPHHQRRHRADDSLFQNAAFVAAAKDWHDAHVFAEGGFATRDDTLEARYEASEEKLFSRIDGLDRDIKNNAISERRVNPAAARQERGVDQTFAYGSAEHRAELEKNIQGTATPEEIRGRLVAVADQGTHPRQAVRNDTEASSGPRRNRSTAPTRERIKGGPVR